MHLEFKKVNDELYEWSSPTSSTIRLYAEEQEEPLALLWNWRWYAELKLSEAAKKRLWKKTKKNASDTHIEDSLFVGELPEDAAQNCATVLGNLLGAKITFELT